MTYQFNEDEISAKAIYERLEDEESREIFCWRYQYYKTGDYAELYRRLVADGPNRINKYNRLRQDVERKKDHPGFRPFSNALDIGENKEMQSKGVVLYGAGALLETYIEYLNCLGVEIKAICDTYKYGSMYGDYRIVSVNEALALRQDAAILITTMKPFYQETIHQSLLERGISEDRIFFSPDLSLNTHTIYMQQYFPADIMKPLSNEIFIDAGCLDGKTIMAFREFTQDIGYRRIYGFEPHKESFQVTLKAMMDNEVRNVAIINKGLWHTSDTMSFKTDNSEGGAGIAPDGEITIEAVPLDDIIEPDDKVTFIKMDIEGAELNALRGASGTIRRDKPRLAICVYHKHEDILEIPAYILSLNPDYKFYMRHHSPLYQCETVLYCI